MGKGEAGVCEEALVIEQQVLEAYSAITQGLINCAVDSDRRALRVNVKDLQWQFIDETSLELSFTLPPGSYATAVLREIITD